MTDEGAILNRLELAHGPDRDLDREIARLTGASQLIEAQAYTASLESAVALVDRLAIECAWSVAVERGEPGLPYRATIRTAPDWDLFHSRAIRMAEAYQQTPALALLLALFRFLHEGEDNGCKPQSEDFPHGLRIGDIVRRLETYRGGPDDGKETILRATYPVGSMWEVVDVNKFNVSLFAGGHWWPDAYGFELVERPQNETGDDNG